MASRVQIFSDNAVANVSAAPRAGAGGQAKVFGAAPRTALAALVNGQAKNRGVTKRKSTGKAQVQKALASKHEVAHSKHNEAAVVPMEMEDMEDGGDEVAAMGDALPVGVTDIDLAGANEPWAVSEYAQDCYGYMMRQETTLACNPNYLQTQPHMDADMRGVLVDWMVEVHQTFRLLQETLFMSVSTLDRLFSKRKVTADDAQLLATAVMIICSKYEEIYPPEMDDYQHISTYPRDTLVAAEYQVLTELEFNLGQPAAIHFLRRFSQAGDSDVIMHAIGKYLIELSLCSAAMLHFKPSLISAASHMMSREILAEPQLWTPTLEHYSTYTQADLQAPLGVLRQLLKAAPTGKHFQAVYGKYKSPSLQQVATLQCVHDYAGLF